MDVGSLARDLADQAETADQRRTIVFHGDPEATRRAAAKALQAAGLDADGLVVGPERLPGVPVEPVPAERSRTVMGGTWPAAVLDAHEALDPDALGRVVGVVDGGGLFVLLAPPLDAWPDRRDGFDARLAVPPFGPADVAGRFRRRLAETLRDHPGIAVVDVDAGEIVDDGRLDAGPRPVPEPTPPAEALFADDIYRACLTGDQVEAVHALEALADPDAAVVVEADRGRGKSSAAGLAAAALADRGMDVHVTAPALDNAAELLARAREVLAERGTLTRDDEAAIETADGSVTYRPPGEAPAAADAADAVVVDEAAALPVAFLTDLLDVDAGVAFVTTIHGYEGAGRGFSVRFRQRLSAGDRVLHPVEMSAPIRYAPDDPLEAWSFDALLLDAEPAPDVAVADAAPEAARYEVLDRDALAADEDRLREVFGLLVVAHYRTRPSDLARLLDAPNVGVRALTVDDRIVSVALLAREGGLDAELRRRIYEGQTVPGNLIPDVLTSQLRDVDAAEAVGWRVMRIATHPAARRRGLGSKLLAKIREEADVDWLGTAYGATPELIRFWRDNGYRTVHLGTARNPASGEHAVLMVDPLTEAGRRLHDRSAGWLLERIADQLSDPLDDLDPDLVRAVLASVDAEPPTEIPERGWRLVAAAAYGPAIFDVAPGPFRQLLLEHLVAQAVEIPGADERRLVRKVLQGRSWEALAEEMDDPTASAARRAFGDALQPLVDAYGPEAARREADRYR